MANLWGKGVLEKMKSRHALHVELKLESARHALLTELLRRVQNERL